MKNLFKKKNVLIMISILSVLVLIAIILTLALTLGRKGDNQNNGSTMPIINSTPTPTIIPSQQTSTPITEQEVEFVVLAPESTNQVFLVGSLSGDWNLDKAYEMSKSVDGKWHVKITLPIGRYEYNYINARDWDYIEKNNEGSEITVSRILIVGQKPVKIDDIIDSWVNLWKPEASPKEPDEEEISNILSNQFYFETEDEIFYSASDENNHNHIYRLNKKDNTLNVIFDGFGWSLLPLDGWLYFVGNPGQHIDATYYLYRVKIDGSKYEKLNNNYSVGLFLYDDKIYFLQRDETYSDSFHLRRIDLNTLESEEVYKFCKNAMVFKSRFYFIDNSGNLLSYNSNMKDPRVLIQADVKKFTMYENYIIYIDNKNNIKTYNLKTEEIKEFQKETTNNIYSINVYKDLIYFAELDLDSFDYNKYGYEITVRSIDLDGENETELYKYYSLHVSINITNDHIFAFEQRRHPKVDGIAGLFISSVTLEGENYYLLET